MIRVGVVGCGFIGQVHAWAIGALRACGLADAAVTRTYDSIPERARQAAATHGATAAESLEQVLESCDAVWVCTPTAAHAGAVEAAAGAGLAVFCEKPLATTEADAERIAAALTRVPHAVGLVLRASPVFSAIAEAIGSGRFGRVLAAVFRDDQYLPIQGMYGSSWRADASAAGSGTLLEHSIHDVDLLRWLLGDPDEVACVTSSFFGHPGIEDLAAVRLRYEGGAVATLVSVWHQVLSRPSTRRLEVFCEEAVLETDDDYLGPLVVQTSAGREEVRGQAPEWVARLDVPEQARRWLGWYATPTKGFLEALSAGTRGAGPGASEALAAHRIVAAAYRSAAVGGAAVALSPARPGA